MPNESIEVDTRIGKVTSPKLDFNNVDIINKVNRVLQTRQTQAPSLDILPPEFICSRANKEYSAFEYLFVTPLHRQKFTFRYKDVFLRTKSMIIPPLLFKVLCNNRYYGNIPSIFVAAIGDKAGKRDLYRIPLPNVAQTYGHGRICFSSAGGYKAIVPPQTKAKAEKLEGWPMFVEEAFSWVKFYFESYCAFDSHLGNALRGTPRKYTATGLKKQYPTAEKYSQTFEGHSGDGLRGYVFGTLNIYEWWAEQKTVEDVIDNLKLDESFSPADKKLIQSIDGDLL